MYLWCITRDRPLSWLDWLPWGEYCHNTSFHSALRAIPFQVVYGRELPALVPYQPGTAHTQSVDDMLQARDNFLAEVGDCLQQAQQYAKCWYDEHHRDVEFEVGAWVWLRLLHRAMRSLVDTVNSKLALRYAGPFQVLERIGAVAYRLKLPAGAPLHDVFHVRLLKPFQGTPPTSTLTLPPMENGRLLPVPARVLCAGLRRGVWHVLVQWGGMDADNATWEPLDQFKQQYPDHQLEDELFLETGRDVMTGKVYRRRNRQE
ncbi:hypothetical protein BS78_09G109400 [Paspalum vaginatum]|nr:hypothetical protein BS78_09G109400 [Paspalum vaginatum]